MLLDHDRRVVGLASQPFRVTWQGEKRRLSHTPDYFARLEDGSGLVVDVRPADRVGLEDAVKFSATEAMCQERGCWSFALVRGAGHVDRFREIGYTRADPPGRGGANSGRASASCR